MTNAKDILSLVKNYQNIGTEGNVHLEAWKKEYPWFGSLYLLEAKSLKNENKFGLKKAIKTASLYAGDRSVLYDFIHDHLAIEQPIGNEVLVDKTPKVSVVETNIIENSPSNKAKPDEVSNIIEPDNEKPIVENKAEVKKQNNDSKPSIDETTKSDKPKRVKPVIVYDPLIALKDKVKQKDTPVKKTVSYDPLVELPKLEKQKPKKDKQDFYSWLDSLKEEETVEPPKPRKLRMSAEASELLENFIKNRPTISKIRKDIDRLEVYQPSKESSDFEVVTESLAQLHIKQGKPELAIEIYEKLGLQNPQKFSYFAALVEKIKKDNNLE